MSAEFCFDLFIYLLVILLAYCGVLSNGSNFFLFHTKYLMSGFELHCVCVCLCVSVSVSLCVCPHSGNKAGIVYITRFV